MIHTPGEHKEETATIVRIDATTIWLTTEPVCVRNKGCHGCHLCDTRPQQILLSVTTPEAGNYLQGESVRIARYIPNQGIVALLLFGTPLLFAVFMQMIWYSLAPGHAQSPLGIATTLAALAGGFFAGWLADKLFVRKYPVQIIAEQ
ncbi:MAG: hypothetical protein GF398_17400 [Chitinivibrionales bacterium]|nr:hypothetical protein [Chitinivibrionales bacterium]